jgi:hypothetical protein
LQEAIAGPRVCDLVEVEDEILADLQDKDRIEKMRNEKERALIEIKELKAFIAMKS